MGMGMGVRSRNGGVNSPLGRGHGFPSTLPPLQAFGFSVLAMVTTTAMKRAWTMLHLEHQSGISRSQGDRKRIPVSLILSDVFICVYLQGLGDMDGASFESFIFWGSGSF
jgi:hypothetical protein